MNSPLEKALLEKIERLEAFEERYGVRLDKISIRVDEEIDTVTVLCEAHPIEGTTIKESLKIEGVLYDANDSIVKVEYDLLMAEQFFGFEMVQCIFMDCAKQDIGRIRIYPKPL